MRGRDLKILYCLSRRREDILLSQRVINSWNEWLTKYEHFTINNFKCFINTVNLNKYWLYTFIEKFTKNLDISWQARNTVLRIAMFYRPKQIYVFWQIKLNRSVRPLSVSYLLNRLYAQSPCKCLLNSISQFIYIAFLQSACQFCQTGSFLPNYKVR